jgi:GntR family transcriptional regulator
VVPPGTARSAQAGVRDRRALPVQIRERLRQRIADGELAPGAKLPSEVEMAIQFEVSRLTVREALRMLQQEMLIESRHGRGHFVTLGPKPINKPISELHGVTELMESLGYPVENVVLDVRRERAAAAGVSERLGVVADEEVVRLERLRTSGGEPMIYSVDVFPAALAPEEPNWESSLLDLLERTPGARIAYSSASIRAARLPEPVRSQVSLPEDLPWILLEQLAHTSEHRPVLFSLDYHRGDRFEFRAVRHRGVGSGK